jgi:SAM-dependent methyltransferase
LERALNALARSGSERCRGRYNDLVAAEESKSESTSSTILQPPIPPQALRRLVTHDDALFDISGAPPFDISSDFYEAVFDFGCGCGRVARQLMCQPKAPSRYIGIDIHKGMIEWCQKELTSWNPAFQFIHHEVWNLGLGPDNTHQSTQPFPVGDSEFSLLIAHSVFTHLYKEQTEFYLAETARILRPGGLARTTWFFFDKSTFPMMADFQVCLYINEIDPTNAVIYDWRWFLEVAARNGLRVEKVTSPQMRGFQWEVYLSKQQPYPVNRFPFESSDLAMLSGSGFDAGRKELSTPSQMTQHGPTAQPSKSGPPIATRRQVLELKHSGPTRLRYTSDLSEGEFLDRTRQLDWWYHSYYFDNGFYVRGDYDIGASVAGYGFPESLVGKSVLDIGTGAGWFAHFFEQMGADVTTVDARGYCDFDVYGRAGYPPIEVEDRAPDRMDENGRPVYYSPVSRGFWTMRDVLGSHIRYVNAKVYDVCPELFGGRKFDLVFLGAILCHLRDPIGALMAAHSVCSGQVMASTPVVIGEPEEEVGPRQYLPYTEIDKISWWLPNAACFRHWFLAAGFENVDISRKVTLLADHIRTVNGRAANGNQLLRVGIASVPR